VEKVKEGNHGMSHLKVQVRGGARKEYRIFAGFYVLDGIQD